MLLHQDKRPGSAARPGHPAKRDDEYKRRGTANVFCAVEPLAGRHFIWPTPNRSGAEFAKTLNQLAAAYPSAQTIHLVLDNLSTHTAKSLRTLYGEKQGQSLWQRFTVHHTPKHASWLNQAEIDISLLRRQCLGSRRIASLQELRRHCRAWSRSMNRPV